VDCEAVEGDGDTIDEGCEPIDEGCMAVNEEGVDADKGCDPIDKGHEAIDEGQETVGRGHDATGEICETVDGGNVFAGGHVVDVGRKAIGSEVFADACRARIGRGSRVIGSWWRLGVGGVGDVRGHWRRGLCRHSCCRHWLRNHWWRRRCSYY